MKICTKCREEKDLAEFSIRSQAKGTFSSWCKVCSRQHDAESWRNSAERRSVRIQQNKAKREAVRRFMMGVLSASSCADCGETDPVVLQFHHLRDKKFNLADATRQGFSIETIKKELDKCITLCANCHLRRTVKESGWSRSRMKG